MARVVVYERAVDAVLTDVTFYEKLNRPQNGIKIKEEPLDPDIDGPSSADQRRSPPLEDQLSNNLNNKENESIPVKHHADPETTRSNPDRKKRKRSSPRNTRGENSHPPKKHRPHARMGLGAKDYQRKRRPPVSVHQCDVCWITFRTQRTLRRHQASLIKFDKCSCDLCGSVYSSTSSLLKHKELCARSQQSNKGSRYYCNFCKRDFGGKTYLQQHLFHFHDDVILHPKIVVDNTQPNTDITQTTKSPVADVCTTTREQTPEKLMDSPSSTSVKKMRQTTLTEFLSLFGKQNEKDQKQGCVSPQRSGVATNQGLTLRSHKNALSCDTATTAKATDSSATAAPTPNQSPTSKRPFVQIHVDTKLMMSLLNTKVKSETEDVCAPATTHNTSYNLRRPRTDSTRSSFEHDHGSSHLQRRSRKITQSYQRDIVAWERQMRAKFGCKECVVRIEKCCLSSTIEKTADEPETIPLQVSALKAEGNSEIGRRRSVRTLSVRKLAAPLVETNNDSKNTVVKPEVNLKITHESKDSDKEDEHKAFQCKVCKKSFSSKENIREHMELFHVAYISSVCSARYTTISKLLSHYLRQHAVFRRMQCCVCYEKFEKRMQVKQHMSLHCIKVIRTKNDNLPIGSQTGCNMFKKQHKCRGCSKRFWLQSCLQQHQKVCHRSKDKKNVASPSKKHAAGTAKSSAAHVSRDFEVPGQQPSDCSKQTCENTKIPGAADKQDSQTNLDSRSLDSCSASTPQRKTAQSRKVVSHRRLVNGMACVKGYQTDLTGTDKERFPCSICGKQFQSFQNLCIHERTFCKPNDSLCSVCGTSFTTKRLLQQHMLATHTPTCKDGYKFFCKFCNQGFIKRTNLQIHERHFHTNQSSMDPNSWSPNERARNVNTVCTVCNLMFESYERFIEHNMYYYQGQIFTCAFCSQSFQGMYMLHHHNKLTHYPEGTRNAYTYTCDTCNEGFNQESHFHAHKLHVHFHETCPAQDSLRTIQDQTCQDHSYALTANNVTSADPTTVRVPIMAYTCEVCSLSFTNQRDLSAHETEYSDEGDFQCSKCNRRCPTASVLVKHHSLNHSGNDISHCYKCRSCGEVLTTNTAMVCHEKHFHTASNADRRNRYNAPVQLDANQGTRRTTIDQTANASGNLMCLTCGMRFENEMKLKDHLLEYSDIGDYQCEVCHRKFAEVYRLEVHRIKHSRLNNILNEHHCPICHEGFASAANVRTHVLHLHGYETFPSVAIKRTYTPPIAKQFPAMSKRVNQEIGSPKVNQANGNGERVNADFQLSNSIDKLSTSVPSVPTDSTRPPNDSVSPSPNQAQVQGAKCPECGLVFNSLTTLKKHRSRFTNRGEYSCKYCGRKFDRYKTLNAHVLKHSMDVQLCFLKYECSHCGEKFRTAISVYSHVVHIHGKDKLKGKCIITNRSGISDDILEYSTLCVSGTLMKQVFTNDDLEIDHSPARGTKTVDAVISSLKSVRVPSIPPIALSNSEKSSAKSVNNPSSLSNEPTSVIEPLDAIIEAPLPEKTVSFSNLKTRDSENLDEKSLYYTCSVCSQKYPTLKKFQAHFTVSHGNMILGTITAPPKVPKPNIVNCMNCTSTFCNESELKEHMQISHPLYPPTYQAMTQQPSSSVLVDSDIVEIIWEKNATITRSIESLTSQDLTSQDSTSQDSVILMIQPVSFTPSTVVAVNEDIGKLKVKSFARMFN
ncbi:uncharacterized protein LOC143375522 isoform X2 [Andrena cerasifolii]|uniref:uncharacterized protein LOC143375522 isoform X2 n=1 Tax=Andrena cerasifolii TaxID=2819439 RepID=UPI0040381D18